MKILALELSSARGSVAFLNGDTAQSVQFANDRQHSGNFFSEVRSHTERYGTPDRVLVGLGRGSSAGTRIAIGAAVGLQAATGAELLGMNSICGLDVDAP